MANLTGDFDVVAQFAVRTVNRLLAAMHASERFPHSMSLHVDDSPPPGTRADWPVVVASVDTYGEPTVNHTQVGPLVPLSPGAIVLGSLVSVLDPVVNVGGVLDTPIIPSNLKGKAQLQ